MTSRMTYADRVANAPSPQAALLVLAEGIDAILSQPAQVDDGWGTWTSPTPVPQQAITDTAHALADLVTKQSFDAGQVAQLRKRMETAEGDDRAALEAALRLAQDSGAPPVDLVSEGTIVAADEDGLVDLPVPSDAVQDERYDWALENHIGTRFDTGLSDEDFALAFSKGGPMWLYLGNRDAVMQMPVDWRRAFVEDIAQQSQRQAHEVGRDILKDETANGPALALEALS